MNFLVHKETGYLLWPSFNEKIIKCDKDLCMEVDENFLKDYFKDEEDLLKYKKMCLQTEVQFFD